MTDRDAVIPLIEETFSVEARRVEQGRVRVRTVTDAVEELAKAALETQTVEITRIPIDREVKDVPQVRVEGDLTIIPVFEEVLFVEKRLMLREEIHVKRRTTSEEFQSPVILRKQRAVVERLDEKGLTRNSEDEGND